MPVDVGTAPALGFVALIVAAVVILATAYARRSGHLRSRGALIAIAILVALLIVYGLGYYLVA